MKKLLVAFLFFLPAISHAVITDEGVTREKTFVIHFSSTVSANTTLFVDLISLSTTSKLFPHTYNDPLDVGELDVSHVEILFDKVATASTTAKVGVINYVSPSSGSITYIWSRSSLNNVSNTDVIASQNYTPSFYRCRVYSQPGATNSNVNGLTPFILSNEMDSGLGTFVSTGSITSPILAGAIQPRTGDIVAKITTFTSAVNYIINVWYHAEH